MHDEISAVFYTMKGFDHLLQLPLFMGMARDDLQQIVAHTKFDFFKRPANANVIAEGDRCESVIIMTHGIISMEKWSDDRGYGVRETLKAPFILQLEHLFGLTQRYSATFTTLSPCNFMAISKREVMFLFEQFDVFRINYLNILAAKAQKAQSRIWHPALNDDRSRITDFLLSHCQHPAGPKEFTILMTRLATEINASRLDVSRALNKMQQEGLVELHRGRIVIPELRQLV